MTVELDEVLHRRAKALAAEHGVSLSLLVRGFLADYIGTAEREAERRKEELPAVVDGQLTVDEVEPEVIRRVKGQVKASSKRAASFNPGCRNATYHWKNGPGNPCRFCGGEA